MAVLQRSTKALPAMNLWRLEWLRLWRTPRALSLAAVFVLFGLVDPVITRYQDVLLAHVGNGVRVTLPAPTPALGLGSYVNEAMVVGLVVVVAIAAGSLTFDAQHGPAVFL